MTRGNGAVKTADIVILGAGVMGTSIAYHLAKRGAHRVTIVDKDHAGSGNSSRSSALVRMHYTYAPEVQLAVWSLKMFENWHEIFGTPTHFRKTGFARIVPADESELLKANVAMQQANGARARIVSRAELKAIEPDWNVDDVELAAYEPDSGYGDGASVANDFLSRAREMGVTYLPRVQVRSILVDGGRVQGVLTDQGRITAPKVLSAIGPWSAPLFKEIGVDLPIETEYHEVAILKNPSGMKRAGCACIDSILETYFRSEGNDQTLVGAFSGPRDVDPDDFPQRASQDSLAEIAERACRRIPALQNGELVGGVTGVYDMTPDACPLLGEVPGVEGLYLAAGFSGMGFKISPAIGLVMSELLLDGRATTVDVSSFRPSRYAEGMAIKARFEYQNDTGGSKRQAPR